MTTTDPMLQDGLRRSSVAVPILATVVILLLIADVVSWLYKGAQSYFVVSPGSAPVVSADPSCRSVGGGNFSLPNGSPCVRLVLPAGKAHQVDGTVMMVDVLEGQAHWNDYLLHWFHLLHAVDPSLRLIPAINVLGNTPVSQLNCQNNQDMTDSTSFAAVAALRHLGYKVAEVDHGARVYLVIPGTAAAAAGVRCNDLITAVNGAAVHTNVELGDRIRALAPGDTVHVTVERVGRGGARTPVQLSARLTGAPAQAGQPARPNVAFLGVAGNTDTTFSFPFSVQIEVGDIGGPSAGLALTLGLLDALSDGQLTGGLKIAATGTIDQVGNVGPIGDAGLKAIAVRRAGAQVFFVPPGNYSDAKSQAGSMKVFQVSTLAQALQDLKSLGGHVPNPASSQNGAG